VTIDNVQNVFFRGGCIIETSQLFLSLLSVVAQPCGNTVGNGRTNEVTQWSIRLVLFISIKTLYSTKICRPTRLGHLTVGTAKWVLAMVAIASPGKSGEFYITIDPITRTSGIVAQSVKGNGC